MTMLRCSDRALTSKQCLFVSHYVASGENATEAGRRAGCADPNVQGARLLGNVRVREGIERERERFARSAEGLRLTPDWLLAQVRDTYFHASEAGQLAAANKSLELVGRHIDAWEATPPQDEMAVKWLQWLAGSAGPTSVVAEEGEARALGPGSDEQVP